MESNLLRPEWSDLDSTELLFILLELVGRPGQYDGLTTNPNIFFVPLAGAASHLKLTFSDKKQLVAIARGPAFDPAEWERVSKLIDGGRVEVGREFSFCSFRVNGSWRGERSGVQILPPPPDAPIAPDGMAENPFILEFPVRVTDEWTVTNFRRMREHRRLTFLLNVLLTGRATIQPRRSRHLWAVEPGRAAPKWVQEFFFAKLGEAVQPQLSPASTESIREVEAETYYGELGYDGRPLGVPKDLDVSICNFMRLSKQYREKFDRAAFWMESAAKQSTIAASAAFASLAVAVEALGDRALGPTARFQTFLERYAPGKSLEPRRKEMYALRSDILHGSGLLTMDQEFHLGWAPPELKERNLMEELWGLTRIAARNWLKNPS